MSAPPDDRMSELLALFFESAQELVQKMNEEALRLERTPGDPETSHSLRRTVHTLKGDAAACNFRELSELAHEFEDVLALDNPAVASSVPVLALRAADLFAALLAAYRGKTILPDVQSLREDIARLAHAQCGDLPAKTPARPKRKAPTTLHRWSEYEQLAIARALEDGKRVHHVVVHLDPQCGMPIAARQMLQLALASLGEVLALYPAENSAVATTTQIEFAVASVKSPEQIRLKCLIPTISEKVKVAALRRQAAAAPLPPSAASADIPDAKENVQLQTPADAEIARNESHTSPRNPETAPPAAPSVSDNILRVEAERIDNVLDLVGELILAKSMLQQALIEFSQRFPKDDLRGRLNDVLAFQGRILNDLQRSVMKVRMVPVDQLFRRFPRVARDVAHQCGKEVELVIQGGETDLDKSILDALAEPLTHLLRNAVGHGIEAAPARANAGKRQQGTLRLSAYHQGNQVVVEVCDDGAGIDVGKVRSRAVALGIVGPEEAVHLSEAETLALILRPGFSTAEKVTELSGRGIGLDVVQSVLSRLKGTVQIETMAGRGTTFRLRLPLTLAIIRALLFRVEQRLYALPLNAVTEIARITEEAIHEVDNYEVLQLRKDVLPLLRLGAMPEPCLESAQRKIFVLVVKHGERKLGLIVDELAGEDELVIKALDDNSITTDLVSGAAILGDGRVVLILNLIALQERFTRGRLARGSRAPGLLSGLNSVLGNHSPQVRGAATGRV